MSNTIIQTVFSDTALNAAKGIVNTMLPAKYRWIALTALAVAAMVDDLDRVEDLRGDEKMDAVVTAVVTALDEADDVPGWSNLAESERDSLLASLAEIFVFITRCVKAKGIPAHADYPRSRITTAAAEFVGVVLELFDGIAASNETGDGAVGAVGAILDAVKRAEALQNARP